MKAARCRVAVIGAGPGGLSVATELKRLGVDKVTLLEREQSAGGIPRHCGHSPFGMREFHRVLGGADYTQRLVERAETAGVEIQLCTTVTEFGQSGDLSLSTLEGQQHIEADRVVICTGAREQPRAARLVAGTRPQGVMTTGALQSMIYAQRQKPCKRAVIIGSEMIAFSAFLSCRHAGIKPVAMVEAGPAVSWWWLATLYPRLFSTPVLTGTSLESIVGQSKVEGVILKRPGGELARLECDGVIFTGQFIAESSLAKMAGFAIDPATNSPRVDAFGRCSNLHYFAGGNIRPPLKTAGQCWRAGIDLATQVKASLDGRLPATWVVKDQGHRA